MEAASKIYRFPVSVKGVILQQQQVFLLKNERHEWELPGGKLELDETPATCVEREIQEETGLQVRAQQLLDTWVYQITPEAIVLIVTYGCSAPATKQFKLSNEHKAGQWFALTQIPALPMPEGYKQSIAAWKTLSEKTNSG